jgi:RHS repeat-associated protein
MTDKQHVGITSGKFSVTKSGQSAYHVPIKVPPGTARMEPSLALSYVGNQRNGLLGVGFTLSGLPSISRTGQTMAQDQKWTAVNYSADDRFTLAGERLIAVQGNDGADGTEYRTERESWARIISHGDLGGGPEWFEVTSRSGRKLIFGNDASARVPALNGTAIRTWALNRVTDLNGNYYTVSYELDEVDGTHRPLTIEYTGNDTTSPVLTPNRRVIFSYEDRSDPVRGYSGGHAYTQTKRLKSISTYLDDQLVRTYQVGYREAAVTARSELVTIVESDGQGIALPTLTLTRPDETTSWWEAAAQLPVVPDPTGDNYVALNGDLTGDGRTDLVIVWEAGNEGTISYAAFIAQEDGTFAEPVLGSTPYPLSNLGPAPVDIKGTGRTDLISFYNWNDSQGNQSLAYSTFIWENNKFTVSDPVFVKLDGLPPNFVPQIVPVDVNGDGKSELFIPVQSESGTMSYHLLVWDGQSYTRQSGGDTSIPMVNVYMPMLMAANITGTPLQDIVCGSNADVMEIYTLFSNGSGFEAPQEPLKLAYGGGDQDLLIPIDTTGDGLTDFAFVWRHRGKTQLTVLVSDGTKITEPVPALLPIDLGDVIPSLSPVDLTGDRRTDLLLYTLDGFENSVVTPLLARNGSFVVQPSIATNLDVQPWAITTPDVKGVGRNDLLITAPAGENLQFNVYRSAASNLGLVKSISNGIGGEIAITYLPATDSRVYSESATPNVGIGRLAGRSSAATIPAVQMATSGPMAPSLVRNVIEIPLNLVWRVERSDGLGQSYVKESLYEDGLVSLEGRGWLGFAKTTVTDLDTSSTLETTYRQDFPFTSQVHTASRGWAGETQALRTRSYQYEVKNPTSPRVSVTQLQQRVTTVNSDFLGESSSQTSIHGYDDFGNRLTTTYSSPQAGPSADVFITRTFDNDTTNWCLGLMRSSVACADAARKQVLRRRDYTYYPATKQLETSSHWNSTDPDDSPGTTLSYDNFGNVESVASSSGALTTLTFEPETAHTYPKTRTRKASDGTNLVDTFTYDLRFGVWTTHQDANGNVRRRTFDDLGRVKDVFVPGPSGEVQFQHTDRQLQPTAGYTKTTSQLRTWDGTIHRVTTRYFDGLARRYSTMRQAEGGPPAWQRVVQSQLDSRGRSKSRSLPFLLGEPVLWTKTTFDPLGRVIERIRPINQSEKSLTKIWYLGLDRITVRGQHSPDAVATIERRSFYNGKPKVVQRADGLGQLSTFDFDQLGRLKTATPPAGTPQSVQYDSVNTPFLIEGSDFGQVKNQVQFAKRRKIMTYANGQNIQVTLDYLNRPVEISLSDGSSYVMGYDVAGPGNRMGRLATVTATRAGSTLYSWLQEYDKLGRRTSLQLSIDGSTYTQQRSHYPSGRIEEITFQDTTKAKYSYDGLGQIRELTFITADGKEHAIATYGSYNAFGRPQTGAAGNGIGKRWSYTVRGQIKQQQVLAPGANGAVLFSRLFGRDTFGRLLSVTDTVTGKLLDHYDYDQAGQLRTWTDSAGSQHQLEFDPTGNIKSTGTRNLSYEGSTITVTPNGGDAYTLTYDVSGNRATRTNANGPDSKFAYDSRNLLIAVDGTSFLYNHRGRRLVKASSTGGRTVYLTSDDIISSGASVKLLRDPYGVAAVVETPTGNAPQRLYFLDRDQVNSTVLISDQGGAVLAAPRYEPFGRLLNPTTGLSPYLPGFGGQQFDVETGLAYFNARYYDPEIGRFITVDSKLGSILTGTNSLNRFAFALNNPINLADPSGHGLFDWLFSAILDLIEIVAGAIAGYFGAEPLAGALIGAGVSGLVYEGGALASGQSFSWAGWGIAEGIGAVTGLFGGIGAGGAAGEAAAEVAEEGVAGGLEIGEEAGGSESSEGENFSQAGDSEPEGGWDPSEELNSASDDDGLYRGLRDLLPEHIEGPDLPDDVPPPPPPPGEGGPMMDDEFSTSDDSWDDGDDVPHNNNDGPAPPGPPRLWPPPPPGAQFGLAPPDLPDLDMSLDSG